MSCDIILTSGNGKASLAFTIDIKVGIAFAQDRIYNMVTASLGKAKGAERTDCLLTALSLDGKERQANVKLLPTFFSIAI